MSTPGPATVKPAGRAEELLAEFAASGGDERHVPAE